MPADLPTTAAAVDRSRRELEQRLEQLNAAPVYLKMQHARYVVASIFELLDHQARFNQQAIAELAELRQAAAR